MATYFSEYFEHHKKCLEYDSRSSLAPNSMVEVLAFCDAIAEGKMGRENAEQN